MASIYLVPQWFIGFNVLFEILFAFMAGFLAVYSRRIYKICKERESLMFSISFLSLSIAYFLMAFINIVFISLMDDKIGALTIHRVMDLKALVVGVYLLLFVIGYVTLFYTTLKTKSLRVWFALVVTSLLAIWLTSRPSLMVYSLSSLYLLLVAGYYGKQYKKTNNKNTLWIFIGFVSLILSNASLMMVINYSMPNAYVVSHILEAIGYAFIMVSLINILKHGKKKEQA